jgi:Tfp pilus assembly PilM family ATPase
MKSPVFASPDLFSRCANAVSVLKDEVEKILTYWRSHGGNKDRETPKMPQKIILSGRPAGVEGFASYLSSAFPLPVESGDVWQNAFSLDKYLPAIPHSESPLFAAAVGLALEN